MIESNIPQDEYWTLTIYSENPTMVVTELYDDEFLCNLEHDAYVNAMTDPTYCERHCPEYDSFGTCMHGRATSIYKAPASRSESLSDHPCTRPDLNH